MPLLICTLPDTFTVAWPASHSHEPPTAEDAYVKLVKLRIAVGPLPLVGPVENRAALVTVKIPGMESE